MTISFIIHTGTLLGAKQGSWHHSPAASCQLPGAALLTAGAEVWRVRVGGDQSQSRWAAHTPHPHSFIHSFAPPPSPCRHLGSRGGEPAPEFQEGKERLHQGEQAPRGAPGANSSTPSTAGAQHSATRPPPPLTLATRLRTLGGIGRPGDSSGSWGIARGSGPRCVPSGSVSDDPLSLRVARISPLPPESIRRGPHWGTAAWVPVSLHWGPWLGPGTWGHQLPSPCAHALRLQMVLCPPTLGLQRTQVTP